MRSSKNWPVQMNYRSPGIRYERRGVGELYYESCTKQTKLMIRAYMGVPQRVIN